MVRPLLVAMSAVVLAVGVAVAGTRGDASYAPEEVLRAFAENGFTLSEIAPDGESSSGWTGYAPLPATAHGRFFTPEPGGEGPFYVFVAQNDVGAREFFARRSLRPATARESSISARGTSSSAPMPLSPRPASPPTSAAGSKPRCGSWTRQAEWP